MTNNRYRPIFATTLRLRGAFSKPSTLSSTLAQKNERLIGADEQADEIARLKTLQAESMAAFKALFPNGAVIDSGADFLQ